MSGDNRPMLRNYYEVPAVVADSVSVCECDRGHPTQGACGVGGRGALAKPG